MLQSRLCNEVFDTPEVERYFPRPLTWPAHRVKSALMRHYFIPTNRDCWAHAMAASPLDVKAVIWKHEEDELIFDPRLGSAHARLDEDRPDRHGGAASAVEAVEPPPGALVALFARRQFAKDGAWLAALAASHVIERINDPSVIQGPPSRSAVCCKWSRTCRCHGRSCPRARGSTWTPTWNMAR